MVDVVEQAHPNTALVRREERCEDERAGLRLEPDVVQREVERPTRVVEERRDLACDARGRLAAVGQRRQLDGSSHDELGAVKAEAIGYA